jgi:hypothetical protein
MYLFFSGFKNIFRRLTVKKYTPMTRAFAESFLDPFKIIAGFIVKNNQDKKYFVITLICSIIMTLFSCVFNDINFLFYIKKEKNSDNMYIAGIFYV